MHIEPPSRVGRPIEPVGMINVIFLLLIFFLVAGSLTPRPPKSIDLVRLPDGGSEPVATATDTLALDANGVWFLRDEAMTADELPGILAGRDGSQALMLYVDRSLAAGRLAERLDTLAQLGVRRLRVVASSGEAQ